jgi:hypothetical protein
MLLQGVAETRHNGNVLSFPPDVLSLNLLTGFQLNLVLACPQ